jgi:hypothetical protein
MRDAVHRPGPPQPHGQVIPVQLHTGVRRQVEVHAHAAAVADMDSCVEEAEMLDDGDPLRPGLSVGRTPDRHAAFGGLEQDGRVERIHSARPQPDGARISGPRGPARAEGARQQHGLAIEPRRAALAFGQDEAVRYEAARVQIELAHHGRVLATAAEAQESKVKIAVEDCGSDPDPILALSSGKGIEIEQDLPVRDRGAIAGLVDTPPQPTRMFGILPEIVEPGAKALDERDPARPVEKAAGDVAVAEEAGIAVAGERLRVARLDPGQRVGPVDLF